MRSARSRGSIPSILLGIGEGYLGLLERLIPAPPKEGIDYDRTRA